MKLKQQYDLFECVLFVLLFGCLLLFMHGCSWLPKNKGALIDFSNAGISGNEPHVINSTGTVVNGSVTGLNISSMTVTMQTKAINVDKGAVKFTANVPVTINAPVKIAENINTNVLFWQIIIIIASIIAGCIILTMFSIWLYIRFKK